MHKINNTYSLIPKIGKIIDGEYEFKENIVSLDKEEHLIISGTNSETILSSIIFSLHENKHDFILIDSGGLYSYLSSIKINRYILGWNYSLSLDLLEKYIGNNRDILFYTYSQLFSTFLEMNEYEKIVLQDILIKILGKDGELLVNLRDELENILYLSTHVIKKSFIEKILSTIDILMHSFLKATFLNENNNVLYKNCIIDYSFIPPVFRNLALLLNLILLREEDIEFIIIDLNGISRRKILFESEIVRNVFQSLYERASIVISDKSLSFPLKIWPQSIKSLILTQIHDPDEINILSRIGFSKNLLYKLMFLEKDKALILNSDKIYEVRINLETFNYLKNLAIKIPEKTLEYPIYYPKLLLSSIFGRNARIIYGLLDFLREGASNRDGVISYLQYKYGLKNDVASKLMVKAMVHNLIEEVVGRDGRYWIRITLKGISAAEEFEKYMGGGLND